MTPNTTKSPLPLLDEFRGLSEGEADMHARRADDRLNSDELRSSSNGIAQMLLQLMPGNDAPAPRVGGRREPAPSTRQGGGYPDNCTVFELAVGVKKIDADPRMEELAVMGLPEYWLKVAEYLGFDAFLGMWRILDANRNSIPQFSGSNSMAPTLRTYSNYLRFQKNRFVETLAAQGIGPQEIQKRVQTQLCETISITHIQRITQKHKIKR